MKHIVMEDGIYWEIEAVNEFLPVLGLMPVNQSKLVTLQDTDK